MKLACSGCHEWWTIDAADYDFIKEAFAIAGCHYIGGGGKYYVECSGGMRYCGAYFHRCQGHSQYNDLHPCTKRALFHEQEADIICVAHEHVGACGKQVIGERLRYMARTGARKTFDRYASKLGADDKREWCDVPVLILHGSESREGQWITGIPMAAKVLNALNGGE